MIRNYKGFFSWQGNDAYPVQWVNYLVFAIGFITLILLFLFKERLRKNYENKTKYLFFFKSETVMFRTVGIIGIIFSIARLTIMWVGGYSLYWESLGLHLCRFSITLLFIFLAFNKIDWIKYLIYLSIAGFIFAMIFGYEESDVINGMNKTYFAKNWKAFDEINVTTKNGTPVKISNFERLMIFDHITFYHEGWDNVFLYDRIIAHLAILILPTYLYFVKKQKFTVVELYRSLILGLSILFILWTYNALSNYLPDPHWRGNFWYVGTTRNNDMAHAIGPLWIWPVNLFTAAIGGILVIVGFNFIWMTSDKYEWFTEGKIVKVKKSQNWIDFKQEHKELGIKNILKQAIWIKKK